MAKAQGSKPHVIAVPFPAQGHVTPLMKLSRQISAAGIKVTFAVTQPILNQILLAAADEQNNNNDDNNNNNLTLTSIPDGHDERKGPLGLLESLERTMAASLMDLISEINSSDCDAKVSCVLGDISVGWISEVAGKVGAEFVGFTPASAASLAMILHIPELMEQGDIDEFGTVTGSDTISLSANIPSWRTNGLPWSFPIDLNTQKVLFHCSLLSQKTARFQTDLLLCNTFHDIESSACRLHPKLLPVRPLLGPESGASLRPQDTSCLAWLSEKPANSVIYVSFGSLAAFSQRQIDELAIGLELTGRPFLWVVRLDLGGRGSRVRYPDGFLERVDGSGVGKMVDWAPQERVLSHPSVGCFVSHCGWNSTLEGLGNGVPFLCWPYFADQYHNESYICEKWGVGLRIEGDGNGIRSREEISRKVEMLFGDVEVRENAARFKAMAAESVARGGSSFRNFEGFIDHLKSWTIGGGAETES